MKNSKVSILIITAGAFLFNSIFWNEQMAVNAVLFDAFIISSLFFLYDMAWKNKMLRYMLLAHLVCLLVLIMYNSVLGKISFSITLLLLFAFAAYAHRSIWFAGGSMMVGFTHFIGSFSRLLSHSKKDKQPERPVARFIRFAIFPVIIGICFFIIYSAANSVFAGIAGNIGIKLEQFFNGFFALFSFGRLFFLLAGFYLTGSLLLRPGYTRFEKIDAAATDDMRRIRKKRMDIHKSVLYDLTVGVMGKLAKGILALRNEYKTGLISLVLLNGMLLIINIIDINYLWIHFTYTPAIDLFTMIHEGTELLIFSIVMAMLVLLIFFRGNLNFYKKNKWLRIGAYVWLIQNAVLVISVLLRDYYYIREFGLAYKRIGVLFFLLLVIAGLVTVFLKVHYAKTTYFLLRINACCVVFLLVAGSMVQWDVFITEYNIAHRKSAPLNLPYLLTLSDKVLPVLDANLPILKEREKELNAQKIFLGRCSNCIEEVISDRSKWYMQQQDKYTWLSWNYTDAAEKKYFLKKEKRLAVIQ
ncbi:MAG: DUF4173 domain-containing protein [Chitinophagaceae bacterium]